MKKKTLAVLFTALLLTNLLLSGCGSSSSSGTPAETAGEETADAEAEAGERLYSGTSSATDLEELTVSFILSEDRSTIHDITIGVKNFKGTADIPGARVTVELTGSTQTVMAEVPVDYEGENLLLPAGDSTIASLTFLEDGTAEMTFIYCFKQTTPNAFEISVPGIPFTLTSEPAP